MKQRDTVSMPADEVRKLLESGRKLQLATINRDGTPHLVSMFYGMRDGRIAFWTYRASQKARNLARDPRVTCLVEDGEDYFELRGVSVTGTAELVRDEPGIRKIGTAVAQRMARGADLGEIGQAEVERQVTKRVGVLVTPTRMASWDHSKMLDLQ